MLKPLAARSPDQECLIVSIHDVMPQTMRQTLTIVEMLERQQVRPVTLLVVCGCQWPRQDIETLDSLHGRGYQLAGHGWMHHCKSWRSWRHRLHGLLISRDQAEHLALDARAIGETILRCYEWFSSAGLAPPRLYVPPAWALGDIDRSRLRSLPFEAYELLTGIYYARTDRFRALPLVGYEADTPTRVGVLRVLNAANRRLARTLDRPLRVAIHPQDLQLGLARDLGKMLDQRRRFADYHDGATGASDMVLSATRSAE